MKDRWVTRLQSLPRRVKRRVGDRVVRQPFTLSSGAGYPTAGAVYSPREGEASAAVILVPGTNDPAAVFEGWTQPVNAPEIASRGLHAVVYDPSGRGLSWGPEDYGGLEHQDQLRVVVEHVQRTYAPRVLGVLAVSLGLASACGAIARYQLPVDWLLDWEGPCDREIITAGGSIMEPALGHRLDDDFYWHPREAVRHVGNLPCGYVRVQSQKDHAQPGEFRHAQRMVEAAAAGRLPWFALNEHPRNTLVEQPRWYGSGRLAANRTLMSWLERLT